MTDISKPSGPTAITLQQTLPQPTQELASAAVPVGTRILPFGPDHPKFAEWLFASEETATRDPDQFTQAPFNLVAWVAKAVELPDQETGETIRAARLVLIDDHGETVSFASIGAVSSLDLLRHLWGDGPYDPARPVVFKREKTRLGRQLWRIRPHKLS